MSQVSIISGGTDTHIVTLDTVSKGRHGNEVLNILYKCGITTTRYRLIGETPRQGVFGGLRIGTSCVTTRGFTEPDVKEVAACFIDAVYEGEPAAQKITNRVKALCRAHPIYTD